jgi:hypothetical protein
MTTVFLVGALGLLIGSRTRRVIASINRFCRANSWLLDHYIFLESTNNVG